MNAELLIESDWWDAAASASKFGRTEVAPIYCDTGEPIRKYLTKQSWRQGDWPFEETKHFRFWGCSASVKAGTIQFSWNTSAGRQCRQNIKAWAQERGCHSLDEVRKKVGRQWGWYYKLWREEHKL